MTLMLMPLVNLQLTLTLGVTIMLTTLVVVPVWMCQSVRVMFFTTWSLHMYIALLTHTSPSSSLSQQKHISISILVTVTCHHHQCHSFHDKSSALLYWQIHVIITTIINTHLTTASTSPFLLAMRYIAVIISTILMHHHYSRDINTSLSPISSLLTVTHHYNHHHCSPDRDTSSILL